MKASVKKKKMLLVLPLLVIPFLMMAFYALGGGNHSKEQVQDASKGLNVKLPDANLKEENLLDKLSFYDKADKDSAKLAEWMRNDPFYQDKDKIDPFNDLENMTQSTASKYNQKLNVSPYTTLGNDPSDQLLKKLSRLQQEMNANSNEHPETESFNKNISNNDFENDVDRLESMMNAMSKKNEDDPELTQISGVVDKILDVQHPERVRERSKLKPVETSDTWKVSTRSETDTMVNGFFSGATSAFTTADNAIEAVVNENHVIVSGSIIKLRLLQNMFIGSQKIPEGNFIHGLVALNGERLQIEINSIRSGNSLFNIKLKVYDMDGLAGIHIPGAITRDVAKQSADNSLQMMELTSLDPSLKAQAATAGINTAKSLLSKKVKLIKVLVKAGYKVLLKNEGQ